ncbi:MAG TPA: oligosaccharide flippase family protein [Dongiaceae bacterium]|nr:oligosaccharide flippase family protein [Dongiaceae bacterium]
MQSPSNVSIEVTAAQDSAPELLRDEFRRNMGQVSRQSIAFFAGTIFTMGVGYLVKVYVARMLGAELLGLYALGMTLVSLTQLLGCVGLNGAAARYVAVYNANKRYDDLRGFLARSVVIVFLLNIAFSAGFVGAGKWLATRLYHAPALAQYIPLFALLAVLGALNVFYCQVLAGFKDIANRTIISNFVGSTVVGGLTVALLALGTGMRGYLWAQVINSVVVVGLLVAVAWKLTPERARFSSDALPKFDPEVKAFAAASFGMSAVEFLVSQADKMLLGIYLRPELVGIYVVASSLSALIPLILQSVNQIFGPVIADLHSRNRRDVLQRLFQSLTKWVLGLSLPLAFVVIAFAAPLMSIFGPAFEAGWPVLVIGALGQVINCAVGSVGYLLYMSGNQNRLMRVQFVMVGVSLLINVTLIPILGVIGAALAAAAVNVASNIWNLTEVRKALRIFPYNRSYFAMAIPAFLSAGVVVCLRHWRVPTPRAWLEILIALVASYLVFAVFALKFSLDDDDRMIAGSAWAQLRNTLGRGR